MLLRLFKANLFCSWNSSSLKTPHSRRSCSSFNWAIHSVLSLALWKLKAVTCWQFLSAGLCFVHWRMLLQLQKLHLIIPPVIRGMFGGSSRLSHCLHLYIQPLPHIPSFSMSITQLWSSAEMFLFEAVPLEAVFFLLRVGVGSIDFPSQNKVIVLQPSQCT